MNRRSVLRALGLASAGAAIAPTVSASALAVTPAPAPPERVKSQYANQYGTPFLERGVYRAPYCGPAGEAVMFAVAASGVRVAEHLIPYGDDEAAGVAKVWRELDRLDPEHARRRK